eukprot:Lithocolla_globosa_v1_NODE_7_length_11908_cov_272.203830.p7 type:complete len:106 gc:universal NODE_7_length_11908_cov_272.203830:5513-5830(+)
MKENQLMSSMLDKFFFVVGSQPNVREINKHCLEMTLFPGLWTTEVLQRPETIKFFEKPIQLKYLKKQNFLAKVKQFQIITKTESVFCGKYPTSKFYFSLPSENIQ